MSFQNSPAAAMAIYPFILLKKPQYKKNSVLINHEKIHHKQQLELLILPFYILYLLSYLVNLIIYLNHHKAYLHIPFEKEAYLNEKNFDYLKSRKMFGWAL